MTNEFIIREAVSTAIPALAQLQVVTWAATYPEVKDPPAFEIRAWQWEQQFNSMDKNWFCFVIENEKTGLIGFAKGITYDHNELPQFKGELNKIYILKQYQQHGLGTRLLETVVKRFLSIGINSMVLFGEAQNPFLAFYEKTGGKKFYAKNGEFHGGYGWTDLKKTFSVNE